MKYEAIREEIKNLSANQRNLKPQRKTVRFNGTRTVSSGNAIGAVNRNRYNLRHLYLAYAKLRGKNLDEVENPEKVRENNSPDMGFVEHLCDKYKESEEAAV